MVTDGAADLPDRLAAGLNIEVVRGPVCFGENRWRGVPGEFWAALRHGERLPATEAPSVEQLAAAYGQASGPVLAAHVSGELSRTVAHARAAAVASAGEVEVVDTRSLSVGTALVVAAAGEAVAAGVEEDRLRELVSGLVDAVHVHAVIDDVEFLVRGGRAGLVAAKVSKHAQRHVVAVKGHVIPVCQVRRRGEAIREMIAHVREHTTEGVSRWAVGHGDASDVDEVVGRLCGLFCSDPAFVTLLGAPVGSHLGPGAVVVGFFSPI